MLQVHSVNQKPAGNKGAGNNLQSPANQPSTQKIPRTGCKRERSEKDSGVSKQRADSRSPYGCADEGIDALEVKRCKTESRKRAVEEVRQEAC